MKQQPVGRSWLVGLALAAWLGTSATASAKEEFDRFLEALRQNRMHETAMVYLDTMRTSNLLSPADKVRIPFEEGVTLVEHARTINDLPRRHDFAKCVLLNEVRTGPFSRQCAHRHPPDGTVGSDQDGFYPREMRLQRLPEQAAKFLADCIQF